MAKRHIIVCVLFWSLLPLMITGCALKANLEGDSTVYKKTKVFLIGVDSEPQEADVYLNEKLIGTTPLERYPLRVQYQIEGIQVFGTATQWRIPTIASQTLTLKKSGYKDVSKEMVLTPEARGSLELKQRMYHFSLEEFSP